MSAEIESVIFRCIAENNRQMPKDKQIPSSTAVVLIGDASTLDSFSLISLLVSLEERLAADLSISCHLIDAVTNAEREPPFSTVGEMTRWIADHSK